MQEKMNELKTRLREIYDINSVISLLGWDQSTYMPVAAAGARGSQSAVLGKIAHEKLTDPELGRLLEDLKSYEENMPYDSDDASLLRITRREFREATRVPSEFVSKFYSHSAKTYTTWVEARKEDNFGKVESLLEKTLQYSREYASFFPGYEHIADPLINQSDYGMTAATIKQLFAALRKELVPLVDEVVKHPSSDACLMQHFSKGKQLRFIDDVITKLGFDFNRGRQDISPHPFMTKFAHGDVRITTRVKETNLAEALFSSIHETGHALYELGINESYEGTPLHRGTSSGVHESQSRLWENIVGRSLPFWKHFYPQLQETFPSQLANVSVYEFYKAINHVERSLIRTDADELTYNLHVIIRFDLELALLDGSLRVKDLPEAWRTRYQEDLGVFSPGDANGVLQDTHWYGGSIGGAFQGYTLGNILSCQFYDAAKTAHPDIEAKVEQGQFAPLHSWLKENLYEHGSKFTAEEVVERATGQAMTIEPYINYLRNKYTQLVMV